MLYYRIHRSDLHNALLDQVTSVDPKVVVLERAEHIEESDDRVTVTFADGTRAEADLPIGADGIKSVVRKHVVDAQQPVFEVQDVRRPIIPLAVDG